MMRTSHLRYTLLGLGLALIACGDSDAPPEGSIDAAPPDAAAMNTDAGEPACPNDISGSVGMACTFEGQVCGGPCTDPCSFCNVIRCATGTWEPVEVFPAPCFDCGDSLQCDQQSAYCHIEHPDVAGMPDMFECRMLPDACVSDATCACLQGELAFDQCTENDAGGITVESSGG